MGEQYQGNLKTMLYAPDVRFKSVLQTSLFYLLVFCMRVGVICLCLAVPSQTELTRPLTELVAGPLP